jgi:hypothetical protein
MNWELNNLGYFPSHFLRFTDQIRIINHNETDKLLVGRSGFSQQKILSKCFNHQSLSDVGHGLYHGNSNPRR